MITNEFNYFQDALDKAHPLDKRGRYMLLAVKGDWTQFLSNSTSKLTYENGKYKRVEVEFKSIADRAESDRHTPADALVYDTSSESLDWKTIYKNTKGIYVKKHGKNLYL